jgi:hypothetical protein
MELIWRWADEADQAHPEYTGVHVVEDDVPLAQAPSWWEEMVVRLRNEIGRLNLS